MKVVLRKINVFSAVLFLFFLFIVSSTRDEIVMMCFVSVVFFLTFLGSATAVQSSELCMLISPSVVRH